MANFIYKPSLSEKRKTPSWTFKEMVEKMSGKPFQQVLEEQKKKNK